MNDAKAIPFQIQINGRGAIVFVTGDSGINTVTITKALEKLIQKYHTPEAVYTVKQLALDSRYSEADIERLGPKRTVDELEAQLENIFKQILSL